MIARLTGKLAEKETDHCIIDVGGVGYRVMISITTFSELPPVGSEVTLQIYTHVREEQLSLYGFRRAEEKLLFQKLISISGVGPRMATTMLSSFPAAELAEAIFRADVARVTSIPGIGKKTAERIIIDLKDKISPLFTAEKGNLLASSQQYEEICSALTNLGYTRASAEKALKKVDGFDSMPLAEAIKLSLKELAKP